MTQELKNQLDAEMESALESGDTDRIRDAMAHATKALCDCQMKTADRVKEIKNLIERGKRTAWDIALGAAKWILLGGGVTEFIRWYLSH